MSLFWPEFVNGCQAFFETHRRTSWRLVQKSLTRSLKLPDSGDVVTCWIVWRYCQHVDSLLSGQTRPIKTTHGDALSTLQTPLLTSLTGWPCQLVVHVLLKRLLFAVWSHFRGGQAPSIVPLPSPHSQGACQLSDFHASSRGALVICQHLFRCDQENGRWWLINGLK